MSFCRLLRPVLWPAVLAVGLATTAHAAPMPLTGELPLSDGDIATLRAQLSFEEFFDTLDFLGALRVFPDDALAPQPIFYLSPVFGADERQDMIGGQQIATDLLELLDAFDELLASINANPVDIARLVAGRDDYLALADRLRDNLLSGDGRQPILDYATRLSKFQAALDQLPKNIDLALHGLTAAQRQQVMAQVISVLDKLAVPLTPADRAQATSDAVGFVITALTKLRATLATMELGVRYATFVSGMTAEQTHLLANYRAIHPNVVLRALPLQLLRVTPVSSVAGVPGALGDQVLAPEMIRGVNASTHGACGVTSSCTVLVEYTEMGARSALLSTHGASVMPAQFHGDVGVSPDPLLTPTTCDMTTLHARLELPFGAGLSGDRELLRAISTPGVCRTASGNATRLASSIVLGTVLRDLLHAPAELANAQRTTLASDVGALVVPTSSFGLLTLLRNALSFPGFLDVLEHTLEQRLMPRFPAELVAALTLSALPTKGTVTFDFDGVPLACWKADPSGQRYLSPCLDAVVPSDIQLAVSTELEARYCKPGDALLACAAKIAAVP